MTDRKAWVFLASVRRSFFTALLFLGLLFALFCGSVSLGMHQLNRHSAWLSTQVSRWVHHRVLVQSVGMHFDSQSFSPVIDLTGVQIYRKPGKKPIQLQHISVELSFIKSVYAQRWVIQKWLLQGVKVVLHQQDDGSWRWRGLSRTHSKSSFNIQQILKTVWPYFNVELLNSSVSFVSREGVRLQGKILSLHGTGNAVDGQLQGAFEMGGRPGSRANFIYTWTHNEADARGMQQRLYMKWGPFDLSQHVPLLHYLGLGTPCIKGIMSGQFWGRRQAGQWQNFQVQAQASDLQVKPSSEAPAYTKTIDSVTMGIKAVHTAHHWRIDVPNLVIHSAQQLWPLHQLSMDEDQDYLTKDTHWLVQGNAVSLAHLQGLMAHYVASSRKYTAWLNQAKPAGLLNHVQLRLNRESGRWHGLRLETDAQNIHWRAGVHYPGVAHLNAYLQLALRSGKIILEPQTTEAVVVRWPQVHQDPWLLENMDGQLSWFLQGKAWHWQVPHMEIGPRDNGLIFRAKGRHNLARPGAWPLAITGHFEIADLASWADQLPEHAFKPHLTAWLKEALVKGRVTEGKFLGRGDFRQWPFMKHQGKLAAAVTWTHMQLNYAKNWPQLQEVSGALTLENAALHMVSDQATAIAGVKSIQADIADIRHPQLQVAITTPFSLKDGLHFLGRSPLAHQPLVARMRVQGRAHLHLVIHVPLAKGHKGITYGGSIASQQASIGLPAWGIQFKKLQGQVLFDTQGLEAHGVEGQWLGQPLRINLSTDKATKAHVLTMQGEMPINPLKNHFHWPVLHFMQGVSHYRAMLTASAVGDTRLDVISDLLGVQVRAPVPYEKPKKKKRWLGVHLHLMPTGKGTLVVNYGPDVSASLALAHEASGMQATSMALVLGKGVQTPVVQKGWVVTGFVPTLAVASWQHYISVYQGLQIGAPQLRTFSLQQVDLSVRDLSWGSHHWSHVTMAMQKHPLGVMWALNQSAIQGSVWIPQAPDGKWQVNFKHLHLAPWQGRVGPAHPLSQNLVLKMPPLVIKVSDLWVGSHNFGTLSLQLKTQSNRLVLSQGVLQGPNVVVHLQGQWQLGHAQKENTSFQGDMYSVNWGYWLRRWHISSDYLGGYGLVQGALSWPGDPLSGQLKNLTGSLHVQLHKGKIIHLSPKTEKAIGLGRFMNALSPESLPSLLHLNAKRLSELGFPLNTAGGSFTFSSGQLALNKVVLEGGVAKIKALGSIDLRARQYHLWINEYPKVTGTVPLLIGLATGPVGGGIAWVVNKIVGQSLVGHLAHRTYLISGSLGSPVVQRIHT